VLLRGIRLLVSLSCGLTIAFEDPDQLSLNRIRSTENEKAVQKGVHSRNTPGSKGPTTSPIRFKLRELHTLPLHKMWHFFKTLRRKLFLTEEFLSVNAWKIPCICHLMSFLCKWRN